MTPTAYDCVAPDGGRYLIRADGDQQPQGWPVSVPLYSAETVAALQAQIDALELLRPHWAKGYSSDSIAAQTTITALNQIWSILGVDNQTAAMDRLRQLTATKDGPCTL